MRWSTVIRGRAADLFEQGKGFKAAAVELGISCETTREWMLVWKAHGREGLCAPRPRRTHYAPEVKLAAARAHVDEGMPVVDVMRKYGVFNRRKVKEWSNLYIDQGPAAFGLE